MPRCPFCRTSRPSPRFALERLARELGILQKHDPALACVIGELVLETRELITSIVKVERPN